MVGDSLRHDIEGARAAGMAGVLIDRIGRYRADELEASPDRVAGRPGLVS